MITKKSQLSEVVNTVLVQTFLDLFIFFFTYHINEERKLIPCTELGMTFKRVCPSLVQYRALAQEVARAGVALSFRNIS